MRPCVPPSTHPFSVNLYLGRIGVIAGVLEPLAALTDSYLFGLYTRKKPTNNWENVKATCVEA